jgi:F420-dependent oxidoreductase-like protein
VYGLREETAVQLGIHVMDFRVTGGPAALGTELARIGAAVEAAGVSRVSVMDHYFQMEHHSDRSDPMLEAYTTLGYLAAHTSTAKLGVLVTGVTYRHPGLLAKIVTTLDVLSGGRGVLGIGAAWYEREHLGLGVPFPPLAERFERLEETLRICLQMWDPDNNGPFEGRHYQLAETLCSPAPLSSPRPQIMIGGMGEKKTLRLLAKYGDACNFFADDNPETVAHKIDVLRRRCEEVGRDPAEIHKTITYRSDAVRSGDADRFVAEVEPYAALGVDTVILPVYPGDVAGWVDQLCAPAVPKLAELTASAMA